MPKEKEVEVQSWTKLEYNLCRTLYHRNPQETDTLTRMLYDAVLEIKRLRERVKQLSDPDLDVRAHELNEIRKELCIKEKCEGVCTCKS
jgi:hypothetical protein